MRRLFTYFAVMVASATLLVGCFGGDYTSAIPEDAISVLRFDANQVLEKSGAKKECLDAFRAELQKQNMPDFMLAIADDLRNTGIDVEAPMYSFAQLVEQDKMLVGVVAKTYNTSLLKRVIERIGEGDLTPQETKEGTLFFDEYDKSAVLGYNDEAVVFGCVVPISGYGKIDAKPYVAKALKSALDGDGNDEIVPAYENNDVAVCLHTTPLVDALKSVLKNDYDADLAKAIAELESAKGSRIDLAFNFAEGSIDLDMVTTNWPKKLNYELGPCSHQNLKYVPSKALAVANLPFDGEKFLVALEKFLNENPMVKQELDKELNRSTSGAMNSTMLMAIANPFLSTVKGDVTVALNDISVEAVWDPYYNYYSGGYREKVTPNLCAVVPVVNDKIMNTASAYFAFSPDVTRISNNLYSVEVEKGMTAFVGQKDNVLFGSMPNNLDVVAIPATESSWYDAVDGSYSYVVVNIAELLNNATISKELNKEIYDELGSAGYEVMQILGLFDYCVATAPTWQSANMSLVLKNQKENSLKQIVDKVKGAILK